jgi:hypothetical protein
MSLKDLMDKVFGQDDEVPGEQVVRLASVSDDTNGTVKPTVASHIRVVIDESGSMSRILGAAIEGFNAFLRQQQQVEDGSVISIWKFSSARNPTPRLLHRASLNLATPLDNYSYRPNGGTALNDAIGDAIMENPTEQNVILAILTDGEENSSLRYNQTQIREMIKAKEALGWEILFLSASALSGLEESKRYGVSLDKVVKFANSAQGFSQGYEAMNSASTTYRSNLNK